MKVVVLAGLIVLASCGQAVRTVCEERIIKCQVPIPEPVQLEKISPEDKPEEKLKKLIHNYGRLKQENYILRETLKMCVEETQNGTN